MKCKLWEYVFSNNAYQYIDSQTIIMLMTIFPLSTLWKMWVEQTVFKRKPVTDCLSEREEELFLENPNTLASELTWSLNPVPAPR